jgi:hypothetical protein
MPKLNTFQRTSVAKETTDGEQAIAAVFDTSVPWGSIASVSFAVFLHVLARQTNGVGETGDYYRTATFKRVAGTLSLVGSVRVIGTDNEDVGGWDVTLDVGDKTVVGTTTGDFIRVLVTGASGDTVKWLVDDFEIKVNDDSPFDA